MNSRALASSKQLITALLQTPFRPCFFEVNGKQFPLMRLEVPIEMDNYLDWLNAQTLFPKIYWENPQSNMKVAAIGNALELNSFPIVSTEEKVRFFGGHDFAPRRHTTWKKFPSGRYTLPLIEIEERKGNSFLCINRLSKNLSVNLEHRKNGCEIIKPLSFMHSPSYPTWEGHIKELLELISQKILTKVVLGRCTHFSFEQNLSPYAILKRLQGKTPTAILFAFQYEQEQAFIGASPEILYEKEDRIIKSVAIAGTRPRGNSCKEDERLSQDLLNNQKERNECNIVKKNVEQTLYSLCKRVYIEKQHILQTSTVQHIAYILGGFLKNHIADWDVIAALHPTPATGGMPKHIAMQEIQKREHFDRGWFGAPVGWVSPDRSSHAVAIRSALVEKNQMHLFAGAGIVKGSTPLGEWEELEQKISQYIVWK